MEITTMDAISSLVKNGLGVSVVPVGKNLTALPRGIRTLAFTDPPVYRTLGLLWRTDNPRRHLIGVLGNTLRQTYGEPVVDT